MQSADAPSRAAIAADVAIDVALAVAGLVVVWLAVLGARSHEISALPWITAGLALGLLGRGVGVWRAPTRVVEPACVVLAIGLTAADRSFFHVQDWLVRPGSLEVSEVLWLLASIAPIGLALLALRRGAQAPSFTLGVAVVALVARSEVPVIPVVMVLACVCAQGLRVHAAVHSPRERIASLGLGAVAMSGALGLLHDLTALAFAHEIELESYYRWATLDAPLPLGVRIGAEVLVILGAVAMARGKTAGLLLLMLATPMITPTLMGWGALAAFGGGCMGFSHPLSWTVGHYLAAALSLALLPWLGPLWRQRHALFGPELERA